MHLAPRLLAATLAISLAAGACTPARPSGNGSGSGNGEGIVLADSQDLGHYNPVAGYAQLGVSPVYEGLLRPTADDDRSVPTLTPALAAAQPTADATASTWTVTLREDVRFTDGSTFDAEDVAATYRAVLDPGSASEIAGSLQMIDTVTATDPHTVTFRLKHSYADFPTKLLLGIAPSEKLTGGPATESSLNRNPVGTGPYRLSELSPTRAVFTANADHAGGPPQVPTLTVVQTDDDNARSQQVAAGDVTGANLPPILAASLDGRNGLRTVAVKSADWRGVSLPEDNPFTVDPAARRAMNLAVDRQAMVEHIFAGHARPASTPLPDLYPGVTAPEPFGHDPAEATRLLDAAGWLPGPDGVRTRDGKRAEFTVHHTASDTVRRDLAVAFAADLAKIGIDVTVTGSSWEQIEPLAPHVAILLAGGAEPYSPDSQLYPALHARSENSGTYDNPAGASDPTVDDALDQARRSLDPGTRNSLYGKALQAYTDNPTQVMLTFVDHTYTYRDSGFTGAAPIIEPHSHGVDWGPWWNLASWHRT